MRCLRITISHASRTCARRLAYSNAYVSIQNDIIKLIRACFNQALELYEDIADIKRVIVHANSLNPEVSLFPSHLRDSTDEFNTQWLINYFGRLTAEQTLACLEEMLRVNIRQNLQTVVQIATKYSDILGPVKLIELFESFKTFEGEFF
jgi:clathrin heavy chain